MMPPEILALIDKPHLLIAVLFVGAMAGMTVEQFVSKQRRDGWKKRNVSRQGSRRTGWGKGGKVLPFQAKPAFDPLANAADQLRVVMAAKFEPQRLLNAGEVKVLTALDTILAEVAPEWRVMAQVSLGEVLKSADADAYRCINSKRVDLLLVDGDCRPRHAIEYQGGGHHQGSAAARDAVKKEALRRAGLGYHEVVAGSTTPAELRRLVEKLLRAGET